jgi:hypothetical protein
MAYMRGHQVANKVDFRPSKDVARTAAQTLGGFGQRAADGVFALLLADVGNRTADYFDGKHSGKVANIGVGGIDLIAPDVGVGELWCHSIPFIIGHQLKQLMTGGFAGDRGFDGVEHVAEDPDQLDGGVPFSAAETTPENFIDMTTLKRCP